MELEVDRYEDALGSYLVKLNNKDLSPRDNRSLSVILHCINDFERISDHAVNIMDSAKEMHDKKLNFSKNAMAEFEVFKSAVHKIVHMAVHAYADNDLENAKVVEPLEQVINNLNAEMKQRHIRRLRKGKCTIELGWVLQDLLTNIERVSDHCSNIAICMIEVKEDEFDAHNYLEELKENNFKWYKHAIYVYKDKFALPENVIDEEESVVSIIKKEDSKSRMWQIIRLFMMAMSEQTTLKEYMIGLTDQTNPKALPRAVYIFPMSLNSMMITQVSSTMLTLRALKSLCTLMSRK